jgi:CheY-like chemotaxis protein
MSAEPFSLLVVEDNDVNRRMLAESLKKHGYQVTSAEDGYQAVGMLMKSRFDLVVLDIMMPGISGLDVLKIVRQCYSPVDLPIVMATARNETNDMVEAFDLGANDYVAKPFNMAAVIARIQAQLRMKAASSQHTPVSVPETHAEYSTQAVGVVLGERYRLEEKIGAGAFGSVYRALHLGLDRAVAVKVLREHIGTSPEEVGKFQREAITTCRIQHQNAVTIYDFGVTPAGAPYLVMELLHGHTLSTELAEIPRMDPMRCAQILLPACDVLALAHAHGIVHRDLKPENIFLHETRGTEVTKVLDFGIAGLLHREGERQMPTEGDTLGTPTYMAPERLQGFQYDGRADVYSLAIMLYEMLTGHPPFRSQSDQLAVVLMHVRDAPKSVRLENTEVSEALERVVMEGLVKDPERRPQIEEFARGLAHATSVDLPTGLRKRESLYVP